MRKMPRILISRVPEDCVNYENAVVRAGGEPLSLYCPEPDLDCDGLVLAGGGDIEPSLLGEENKGSREIDLARDRAECELVKVFAAQGKPILGICRGHQLVNIMLGGSLIQDIGPALERFHSPEPLQQKTDMMHLIRTRENSYMRSFYGAMPFVNSWHHQAVRMEGRGMEATAWSESGLIEACEHKTLPIITVQFHPERMHRTSALDLGDGSLLFDWLIRACGLRMARGK